MSADFINKEIRYSPNQSLETANVMGLFIEKSKVRTILFEISIDLETLPTAYLLLAILF